MSRRKRYLILAEGFSGDPHYGKTMRGVLRYRRDDVVAILDSTRAGRDGGRRADRRHASRRRSRFGPTTALVGVATQGGRFPPAWRELLRSCVEHGLDVENGLHEFLARRPGARASSPRGTASSCATCAGRRADLSTATGANLELDATIVLTVGSDCAIGKMTVSLELDLEARRRGIALGLRPDRPDRDRDRRLGDRGRRGRRRLHRRRRRAARRRGRASAAASCSGSRARARSSTRPTPASRSGSTTAARRTCSCSATRPGATEIEGAGGGRTRSRRWRELVELHERSRCRRGRRGSRRSR